MSIIIEAVASKSSQLPLMTASFGPNDYVNFNDNPYADIERLQDVWKINRHGASSNTIMARTNLGTVDWKKYQPPAILKKAPHITSQILLDVVATSIDNIKARITEEDHQKEAAKAGNGAEEALRAAREEKRKELYLPINIPQDTLTQKAVAVAADNDTASLQSSTDSDYAHPYDYVSFVSEKDMISSSKKGKRRRFALRRLFSRNTEKVGESSTARSDREALRQKLEVRLGAVDFDSADSNTKEAIAALRKNKLFEPVPDLFVECVSCLEEVAIQPAVRVPCHYYCRDCFARLVEAAVQNEEQWPPKCCLNQIPFTTIQKYVPQDLRKRFHERSSEWEIPISERVYCHNRECGLWIKPAKINLAKRQGHCNQGHWTCTICRGPIHGKKECPQDADMNLTNLLAEEEGWKRCFVCHALVEHRDACQHMTCRCGAQFCYVCGQRWRTCNCTMQQLADLKDAVETRKEERRLREDTEASELRAIVAQIEEFERQEALRIELERQEQERLEEERWQQMVKEWREQEALRRAEMELKHKELRQTLDQLHELQKILIDMGQEDDVKNAMKEAEAMKEQLKQKQASERDHLKMSSLDQMKAREHDLEKEYTIRVIHERKVEEGYRQQLQEFYKDVAGAGAEAKVEAGMLPLKRRMDQAHSAWQKWKQEQLNAQRANLEDERTVLEEFMYSARERMDASCAERERELARRISAEKKWVAEVVMERERLLGEKELEEVEGDSDSLFKAEIGAEISIEAMA